MIVSEEQSNKKSSRLGAGFVIVRSPRRAPTRLHERRSPHWYDARARGRGRTVGRVAFLGVSSRGFRRVRVVDWFRFRRRAVPRTGTTT